MSANPSAARLRALAQEFATMADNATTGEWRDGWYGDEARTPRSREYLVDAFRTAAD